MFKKLKSVVLPGLPVLVILAQFHAFAQHQQTGSYSNKHQVPGKWLQEPDKTGHWIINASNPGADIPEVGRSLFDIIIGEGFPGTPDYKIPFPFTELVEKIRNLMELPDDSIKQVRIPIGRSLRRNAAAPDYFHTPRLVIAADSGPRPSAVDAGLNLKGRLFLGYHEKSRTLEVISYNPWAGRFEFQEVQNYGPGLDPEPVYSNRNLCLSCHQNAGPIFPKEPWLETDSNQQIRMRLPRQASTSKIKAEYLPRFDDVWALDYATDRANYFSSSQFMWQQACSVNDKSNAGISIQCRAAMFLAILQYHLLDYVDQNSISFRQWFLPVVVHNWRQKWPGGLLIATADIPDKNPFSSSGSSTQDPLNPRPPRAKWLKPSTHLLTGIIYQTADFITQADIIRIDQFLRKQAIIKDMPADRYQSNCSLKRTADIGSQQHLEFSCYQADAANDAVFSATGVFIVEKDHIIDGNINTLTIPSLTSELRFLDLGKAVIKTDGELRRASIPVYKYESEIGARLFNGTLLRQLDFKWPVTLKELSSADNLPASLLTVDDIEPLYSAIDQMIEENLDGKSDALSAKPFRRHSLLKSLHEKLGMPAQWWQHDQDNTIIAHQNKPGTVQYAAEFSPFYRHCAACHLAQGDYPPGFLAGTAADVKHQLTNCAQKILFRLSLWKNKPEDRLVSPMPPSSWLSIAGLTEDDWLNSSDINQMQQIASQLLLNQNPAPAPLAKTSSLCL